MLCPQPSRSGVRRRPQRLRQRRRGLQIPYTAILGADGKAYLRCLPDPPGAYPCFFFFFFFFGIELYRLRMHFLNLSGPGCQGPWRVFAGPIGECGVRGRGALCSTVPCLQVGGARHSRSAHMGTLATTAANAEGRVSIPRVWQETRLAQEAALSCNGTTVSSNSTRGTGDSNAACCNDPNSRANRQNMYVLHRNMIMMRRSRLVGPICYHSG